MPTKNLPTLDATTLTMSWNKLLTIVNEAQVTLLRTTFSRIATEAWDFSCALFDTKGEMIAQGPMAPSLGVEVTAVNVRDASDMSAPSSHSRVHRMTA